MFYKTDGPHGLPHDPLKSCIVPRPIGWISSVNRVGDYNLAPYSFFNGVCGAPPMVMFATNGKQPHGGKDTASNVEETREFVVNMVGEDLIQAMNTTCAAVPPDVSEADLAGLELEPSETVSVARVKRAPIHLECTYFQTMELPTLSPDDRNAIIVGHVMGVHIADKYIKDGLVDIEAIRPVARMGYMDYTTVEKVYTYTRPE